ncbi:MAG: hypothetical protein COB97_01125 [Paracoccus sp.]|nr:MAG: hypothetical protein COB97_01125 [Paracoccus sp. (in: a-proteobacteria)]
MEADWSKAHRQDPVLVIDPTGLRVMIDGVTVRVSDGRGLRGIALLCLIADIAWGSMRIRNAGDADVALAIFLCGADELMPSDGGDERRPHDSVQGVGA